MKSKSLKENKDFRRLYYRGKSGASKNLVTYVMKCKRPGVRVGITTGKKIGKAYRRNRARRVIRAHFRGLRAEFVQTAILCLLPEQAPARLKCRLCLPIWKSDLFSLV